MSRPLNLNPPIPLPEPVTEAVPVAWGLPNTAITGMKQGLIMVSIDIPSGDQYDGAMWVPLYTTPPTEAEIRRKVLMEAAGKFKSETIKTILINMALAQGEGK